jgi:hypothetical protein
MLKELQGDRLPAWIDAVGDSDLPHLRQFTEGLLPDIDAVTAGLSSPWSSGTGRTPEHPREADEAPRLRQRELRSTPQTHRARAHSHVRRQFSGRTGELGMSGTGAGGERVGACLTVLAGHRTSPPPAADWFSRNVKRPIGGTSQAA